MREEIYHINQKDKNKELIEFSICGTTFPDKRYQISRPHSNTACIEYIERGGGTVYIDGKKFFPVAGDSYFLQERKDQYYFSDAEQPWEKRFINVSGKLLKSLAEGYGLSDVSHFAGLDLGDEIGRIIKLAKQEYDDCTLELIGILNEMFFKMRNHVKGGAEALGIETEMKDFLNTQITSKFQIELLCAHVSKSESQAIRIFKKAYGITPYAYVLNKKIELAKKLLNGTDLSIKQIADKLCFSDEYYFSNLFKAKTGTTPSAYRKKRSFSL